MELAFKIERPDLELLAVAERTYYLARYDRQLAAMHSRVDHWSRRALTPLLIAIVIVVPTIAVYATEDRPSVESVIACAIAILIMLPLVRPLSRWLVSLRPRVRKSATNRSRGVLERHFARRINAPRLARLEGLYQMRIEPEAMVLTLPNGHTVCVAWPEIVELRETKDFYQIITRKQKRIRHFYPVARQTTEMADAEYRDALQQLLRHVRDESSAQHLVAPEARSHA